MKFTKSLQVPGNFPLDNRNNPVKRVLGSASGEKNGCEASLTVEASVCLPLFLMMVWALLQPLFWLDRQRQAQTVTERFCEELSQHEYMARLAAEGAELPQNSEETETEGMEEYRELLSGMDWISGIKNTALGVLLQGRLKRVLGQTEGLRIRDIHTPDEEGNIRIETEYRERIPFFPAAGGYTVMRTAAVRRSWIGIDGKLQSAGERSTETEEDGTVVFTGAGMGRYHLYRDCHYLSNAYRMVGIGEMKTMRNAFGERYQPCARCCRGKTGPMVCITPGGEHYHSGMSCSAMNAYIREVPLEEAEHLGCCSYCSRRKENGK